MPLTQAPRAAVMVGAFPGYSVTIGYAQKFCAAVDNLPAHRCNNHLRGDARSDRGGRRVCLAELRNFLKVGVQWDEAEDRKQPDRRRCRRRYRGAVSGVGTSSQYL